jgi:hypothetical protein
MPGGYGEDTREEWGEDCAVGSWIVQGEGT